MRGNGRQGLIPFLLAVVAGCLALNYWVAVRPIDAMSDATDAEPKAPRATTEPGLPLAPRVPPLEALAETRSRPLFTPSRRPAEPDAESPVTSDTPSAGTSADNLRLVGIMGQGTAKRRALIRVAEHKLARWFEIGTEVDGWKIAAIEDGRVTVERGAVRAQLKLFQPRTDVPQ